MRVISAQGRTGSLKQGNFDKNFMYDIQMKDSTLKKTVLFLPDLYRKN